MEYKRFHRVNNEFVSMHPIVGSLCMKTAIYINELGYDIFILRQNQGRETTVIKETHGFNNSFIKREFFSVFCHRLWKTDYSGNGSSKKR